MSQSMKMLNNLWLAHGDIVIFSRYFKESISCEEI